MDALKVFCHMETEGAHVSVLCLQGKSWWADLGVAKKYIYFEESMNGGFLFSYVESDLPKDVLHGQLIYLQSLSSWAYQNITDHCKNSIAYKDAASRI